MFRLDGRTALVTGAAGSIGKAIVAALAESGATVVGADLAASGDGLALDVTSPESWQAAAAALGERHGALDLLVNCAGIAPMGKIEELDLAAWRRTMAVNVEGVAIGMQACLPLLRAAVGRFEGGPSIVNVASAASARPTAFSAAYCSSKAAVAMLTKVAAVEFSTLGYGIRVNSVHPGVVESVMMDDIMTTFAATGGASTADVKTAILDRYPIKRFAKPTEIGAAIVYLASSEAAYLHGTELHVDGGYLAA